MSDKNVVKVVVRALSRVADRIEDRVKSGAQSANLDAYDVADVLRCVAAEIGGVQAWYVSTRATCVVVWASNVTEAQQLGLAAIGGLVGRPIATDQVWVRPATPDEIDLHG